MVDPSNEPPRPSADGSGDETHPEPEVVKALRVEIDRSFYYQVDNVQNTIRAPEIFKTTPVTSMAGYRILLNRETSRLEQLQLKRADVRYRPCPRRRRCSRWIVRGMRHFGLLLCIGTEGALAAMTFMELGLVDPLYPTGVFLTGLAFFVAVSVVVHTDSPFPNTWSPGALREWSKANKATMTGLSLIALLFVVRASVFASSLTTAPTGSNGLKSVTQSVLAAKIQAHPIQAIIIVVTIPLFLLLTAFTLKRTLGTSAPSPDYGTILEEWRIINREIAVRSRRIELLLKLNHWREKRHKSVSDTLYKIRAQQVARELRRPGAART